MDQLGGLWQTMPRLSGSALFFVLASIGLPGLGDFVGEFLVLLGAFRASPVLAAWATLGVLFSTFYGLKLVARAFHGDNTHHWSLRDLGAREAVVVGVMVVLSLWLGLFPQPVLSSFAPTAERIEQGLRAPLTTLLGGGP